MKRCYRCGIVLTVTTGVVRKKGSEKGKLRSDCRKCGAIAARKWRRKNPKRVLAYVRSWNARNPEKAAGYKRKAAYGISPDDFDRMVQRQSNKCRICKTPMVPTKNRHVDHDHLTGKVRGLLCSNCNTAIGLLDDSPERLIAAVAYLKEAKKEVV